MTVDRSENSPLGSLASDKAEIRRLRDRVDTLEAELAKFTTRELDPAYPPGTSRLEIALTEALGEAEDERDVLRARVEALTEALREIDARCNFFDAPNWHIAQKTLQDIARTALAVAGGVST